MEARKEVQFKLVLLGNSSVGKTSLINRFTKDEFTEFEEPTIGASFLTKKVPLDDGSTVKFDLWDTAGQERYKSLAPMYYKGAAAALVVFDVTAPESFEGAKDWVRELQQNAPPSIIIALAGNKVDLGNRRVTTDQGKELAQRHSLMYFELSAKTGERVQEAFRELAKRLPKGQARKDLGVSLGQPAFKPAASGGCCT